MQTSCVDMMAYFCTLHAIQPDLAHVQHDKGHFLNLHALFKGVHGWFESLVYSYYEHKSKKGTWLYVAISKPLAPSPVYSRFQMICPFHVYATMVENSVYYVYRWP